MHYPELAQAMIAAAERGKAVVPVLARGCPPIYRQIKAARQMSKLLSLWGRSVNYDENAHQEIVDPAILQAIGAVAGVPMRGRIVHSGLQHTYGYLFSLIETPFGYKRERWLSPALDTALGFDTPTLRDRPSAGTLFSNLTCFLGRIAFADRKREARMVERNLSKAAPAVRDYPYHELRGRRLIEEVMLRRGDDSRRIILNTDLVRLPFAAADLNSDTLLVYSVVGGEKARARLLTAFPVTNHVVADLTRETGTRLPVRLRFNAYLAGFAGRTLRGRRTVLDRRQLKTD